MFDEVKADLLGQLAIAAAVVVGLYVTYKLLEKQLRINFPDLFATVQGPSDFVGNGKPLTYPQAQGIAQLIGVDAHGGGWEQSPDKIQVWFYDQSYYDNLTGHFFEHSGGQIIDNLDGTFTTDPDLFIDKGDLRAAIDSMKG